MYYTCSRRGSYEKGHTKQNITPESTYVQSCGYYEDLVLAVPEKIDGYEFVGWFTEPDGQGTQVIDKMKYAMFEHDEMVMSRNLYAYYIPKT